MSHGHLAWYGLYVRPRFENIVTSNLSRKGVDVFLPTYKTRGVPNAHRRIELPLFPNYVFCRSHAADVRSLLMTPGVIHIAGNGTGATPIDELEMEAIKLIVQAGLRCQPCEFLETGRWVRVADGALRNLKGILAENGNGVRIVVGVSLLQRAVLVDLGEATRVVPVSPTGPVSNSALSG